MTRVWICCFLFFAFALQGRPRICLNMIVKNESACIRECLESVRGRIDEWVIVDTGSTDGTQQLIRELLKDVPGELHERSWVNFEVNRNEALELARLHGDYILLIDADELLKMSESLSDLKEGCYFITVREEAAEYRRIFLIDSKLAWRWEGVIHETLLCDHKVSSGLVNGVLLSNTRLGGRSQDPEKYRKDAEILQAEHDRNPECARTVFYLAQSYSNAKEYALAKRYYLKRSCMGGWDQEVYWSLYQAAAMQTFLHEDVAEINARLGQAFQYRPIRAEPLYRLGINFLAIGKDLEAYAIAKLGLQIPMPQDHVFVEKWIYLYGLWLVLGQAASRLGFYLEALEACKQVLVLSDIPNEIRIALEENVKLFKELSFAKERVLQSNGR